jgi:hypothetical protein
MADPRIISGLYKEAKRWFKNNYGNRCWRKSLKKQLARLRRRKAADVQP